MIQSTYNPLPADLAVRAYNGVLVLRDALGHEDNIKLANRVLADLAELTAHIEQQRDGGV